MEQEEYGDITVCETYLFTSLEDWNTHLFFNFHHYTLEKSRDGSFFHIYCNELCMGHFDIRNNIGVLRKIYEVPYINLNCSVRCDESISGESVGDFDNFISKLLSVYGNTFYLSNRVNHKLVDARSYKDHSLLGYHYTGTTYSKVKEK